MTTITDSYAGSSPPCQGQASSAQPPSLSFAIPGWIPGPQPETPVLRHYHLASGVPDPQKPLPSSETPTSTIPETTPETRSLKVNIETVAVSSGLIEKPVKTNEMLAREIQAAVVAKDPVLLKEILGGLTPEVCKTLVNLPNEEGIPPLLQSGLSGSVECMNVLLDHGADPLYKKRDGSTLVHVLARANQAEMLEAFFKRLMGDDRYGKRICRAFTHAVDAGGNTPLLRCLYGKGDEPACVKVLLDWEANILHEDSEGNNFSHLAASQGKPAMLKVFLERLSEGRLGGYRCRTLVNAKNQKETTPVMMVGKSGNKMCLDLLLAAGAQLLEATSSGNTAYSIALVNNQVLMAQSILEREPRLEGIFALKVLGHVFGFIPPQVKLPGFLGTKVVAKGATKAVMHRQILTNLEKPDIQKKFSRFCSESQYEELVLAFARSCSIDFPNKDIAEMICSGKLVILPVGWKNHGITLVFRDGYLVICNRGSGALTGSRSRRTFFARKISVGRVTPELIAEISSKECMENAEEAISYFYKTLPETLQGEETLLCGDIHRESPALSKEGVCAYASGKAALRASLILLTKKTDEDRNNFIMARLGSKCWATAHRKAVLDWFIETPSPFSADYRAEIIEDCLDKIAERRRNGLGF